MGYTHYWYLNPKGNEKKFNEAKLKMSTVILNNSDILANGMGDVNTVPTWGSKVFFNGIDENSHETFALPETLSELDNISQAYVDDDFVFAFCKTRRKPYDIVVVACLVILKHYMGNDVKVSSDGDSEDWKDGLELARKALSMNKNFKNPVIF
jgi:hypothetical protein